METSRKATIAIVTLIFFSLDSKSASAVNIPGTVFLDTIDQLSIAWDYDFAGDPDFLTADSHTLQAPALTNWNIKSLAWSKPLGPPPPPLPIWQYSVVVTHTANPHAGDVQPAQDADFFLNVRIPRDPKPSNPPGPGNGEQTFGVQSDFVTHPSIGHEDEYAMLVTISNNWKDPLDDNIYSNFRLTLKGRHVPHVPGPLPVLGAGVAFGCTRKLRRRIGFARRNEGPTSFN